MRPDYHSEETLGIERLGRSDRRAIRSQPERLLQHVLKGAYQPQGRSSSWRRSLEQTRHEAEEVDHPVV